MFIGGRGPASKYVRRVLKSGDVICAADSGFDFLQVCDLAPDVVVGDMDSISDPGLLEYCSLVERHPTDKSLTDTEIGLRWLRGHGCGEIVMLGGGEQRLDHSLALLGLFGNSAPPVYWYTELEEVRFVDGPVEIEGHEGDGLSIYPVGKGPWEVDSEGLFWEVGKVDWGNFGMSLSNRIVVSRVKLTVRKGAFLLIRPIEQALRGPRP